MTEIETEVKIQRDREFERPSSNAFSSRTFSAKDDLKNFDSYKPKDVNELFIKLEKESQNRTTKAVNFDTDLDSFTKLEEDTFPVVLSKTVEVEQPKAKLKINLQGKLIIFVASVALVLFAFLTIFNAFTISALNSSVEILNNDIAAQEQVLNNKIQSYNELTGEELSLSRASEAGFSTYSSENVHTLSVEKVNLTSSSDANSNWFDDVCEWVAQLFGA